MAATTTPHIAKLVKAILADFNGYNFSPGPDFAWQSGSKTILHPALTHAEHVWSLLHELSHAELGHTVFLTDIALLRFEGDAWRYARTKLAPLYGLQIDPDFIEDNLDTYRLWILKRSSCPECGQTGAQETQNTYRCLNCRCLWRVNEARLCRLKRTRLLGQNRSF